MRVLDKVMEIITDMKEQISAMQGEVKEMAIKIEAIQNSEADIFDPNQEFIESPDLFPRITEQEAGKAAEKE
jgi:TolA-binding protein